MSALDDYWTNSATASVLGSYQRGEATTVTPGARLSLLPLNRRPRVLSVPEQVERMRSTMGRQEGLDLAERYSREATEETRGYWTEVLAGLKAE